MWGSIRKVREREMRKHTRVTERYYCETNGKQSNIFDMQTKQMGYPKPTLACTEWAVVVGYNSKRRSEYTHTHTHIKRAKLHIHLLMF